MNEQLIALSCCCNLNVLLLSQFTLTLRLILNFGLSKQMKIAFLSLSVLSFNLVHAAQTDSSTVLAPVEPIFVTEFRSDLQVSLAQLHSSIADDLKRYEFKAPTFTTLAKPADINESEKAQLLVAKN